MQRDTSAKPMTVRVNTLLPHHTAILVTTILSLVPSLYFPSDSCSEGNIGLVTLEGQSYLLPLHHSPHDLNLRGVEAAQPMELAMFYAVIWLRVPYGVHISVLSLYG